MVQFDERRKWYRGNLHTHTTVSDGRYTPEEAIALYQRMGYDFLALTDHWKLSQGGRWQDMLLLPGIELDTMVEHEGYHIVGVGLRHMPQVNRGASPQALIDAVCAAGGRAILAHPSWSLLCPEHMAQLKGLSGAEVMNAVSQSPFNGDRADSAVLLDITAALGARLPFMAADDSHFYQGEQGSCFIWINAGELTQEALLEAMDAGRFFASQGPRFYQLELTGNRMRVWCSPCERAVFYSDALYRKNRVMSRPHSGYFEYMVEGTEQFVRCELVDISGKKAWSHPYPVEDGRFVRAGSL